MDCNSSLSTQNDKCESCGSNRKIIDLTFYENSLELNESLTFKVKDQTKTGKRKIALEVFTGNDKRKSKNDWVQKERIIDRANDKYGEKVVTSNGEILRDVNSSLKEHTDRGTAKFKKSK